ncbi:MAG: hypothetical protein RL708_295 [Bacteroidota bacterium]
MNEIKYSVVIPVFRAEKYIALLTENIILLNIFHHTNSSPIGEDKGEVIKMNDERGLFFSNTIFTIEIILVADCPVDNSWQIIQQLKLKYPDKITAVLLPKNIGQHATTIEGLKLATGNFIFTIDEDGQHNPNYFEQMIIQQQNLNADVVYGSYKKRSHSIVRNATSFFSKAIFKIFIPNFYWHYTSFRLITFETAKKIISTNINYPFIDGMIFLNTNKIADISVQHTIDATGKSSYSIFALIKHFIKIMFAYSFKKLKSF